MSDRVSGIAGTHVQGQLPDFDSRIAAMKQNVLVCRKCTLVCPGVLGTSHPDGSGRKMVFGLSLQLVYKLYFKIKV